MTGILLMAISLGSISCSIPAFDTVALHRDLSHQKVPLVRLCMHVFGRRVLG